MQYTIFLYGLISAMYLFINSMVFFMSYSKQRNKTLLAISVAYFFFFLDDIFFYMSDFIADFSPHFTSSVHYEPIIKTLIIVGILASYRMIVYYGLDTGFSKAEKLFGIICVVILVIIPLFTLTPLTNFFYNTLTWGYTFYVLVLGIIYTRRSEYTDQENFNIRRFLVICLVLQIFAYCETIYWIIADEFLLQKLLPNVGQRRLGLEMVTLLYNIVGFIHTVSYFRPSTKPLESESDIQGKLDAFIEEFVLTPREGEVLALVAKRYTNQEICDELHISIGTVKTHIHNIFVKTDVSKRAEIIDLLSNQRI